jgi:hypothetical protein
VSFFTFFITGFRLGKTANLKLVALENRNRLEDAWETYLAMMKP